MYFVKQNIHGAEQFFQIGTAFHLRLISENKTFSAMSKHASRFQFPSIPTLNAMRRVAEIVDTGNPWSEKSPFPKTTRSTTSQEHDQIAKDIDNLADDIRQHAQRHVTTEFIPTIKFEEGRGPEAAIAVIYLYFKDFYTFDPTDILGIKTIQEMSEETYGIVMTKMSSFLPMQFPQVSGLHNADVVGMIILILENYAGTNSQYNIEGKIHKLISEYGVINNDSPVVFANTIHDFLHTAYKLNQHINEQGIRGTLDRHFQQSSQIDGVLRNRITSLIAADSSMADILHSLQGLTIDQACPTVASSSFAATAQALQTSTTMTPSLLHSQQKEAQQGLRSAVQPSGNSNPSSHDKKRWKQIDSVHTTKISILSSI